MIEITVTPVYKTDEEVAEFGRSILRYYVENPNELPEELKARYRALFNKEVGSA